MKIAYIVNTVFPNKQANGVHVVKMYNAFSQQRDALLIVPNYKQEVSTSIEEYYGLKQKMNVKYISPMNFKGAFYVFAFMSVIYSWIKGYELIYTRTLEVAFAAGLLQRRCIFEAHSPYLYHSKLKKTVFALTLKMKSIEKLIVISKKLQSIIESAFNVGSIKFQVLHDAGDLADAEPKQIVANKKLNLGYFGSLFEGRGIELILEVAKKLPNYEFHIYGGKNNEIERYKNLSKNISNIKFYGFVDPNQVIIQMKKMDILLAPYQKKVLTSGGHDSSQWMSPIKIFEYMSLGIPMICSDLPVLREVLKHKSNAILCDSESPEDWSKGIELLATKPDLYWQISNQSLADIQTQYNWYERVKSALKDLPH